MSDTMFDVLIILGCLSVIFCALVGTVLCIHGINKERREAKQWQDLHDKLNLP